MPTKQTATKSRTLLVERLRGKIRRVETTGRNDDGTVVSSGSSALDQMLPAGGYNRGTIVEWLADDGSGTDFLSMLAARNATAEGGALVIVDQHNQFYPPAARAMGINLSNLIVLRSVQRQHPTLDNTSDEDFLWAIDQSLRCPAVAAVWGCLPQFESPQIAERWLRRFQLSAESSGCLGLFVRENNAKLEASWSEIQWQIEPQASYAQPTRAARAAWHPDHTNREAWQPVSQSHDLRRIRATLTRCRGGTAGRSVELEINTVTGNVQTARREHATHSKQPNRPPRPLPLAAQLAHSKTGRRSARA